VHVPEAKRSKLEAKAQKLVFVGYSNDHKGYRFLDRETDRITISRDARFIEFSNGSEQSTKSNDVSESTTVEESETESLETRLTQPTDVVEQANLRKCPESNQMMFSMTSTVLHRRSGGTRADIGSSKQRSVTSVLLGVFDWYDGTSRGTN